MREVQKAAGSGHTSLMLSGVVWAGDTDECHNHKDSSGSPKYGRNHLEQQFPKHSPQSPTPFEGQVYEAKTNFIMTLKLLASVITILS